MSIVAVCSQEVFDSNVAYKIVGEMKEKYENSTIAKSIFRSYVTKDETNSDASSAYTFGSVKTQLISLNCSWHARKRMVQRNISDNEIRACIKHGMRSFKKRAFVCDDTNCVVVCIFKKRLPFVITVYSKNTKPTKTCSIIVDQAMALVNELQFEEALQLLEANDTNQAWILEDKEAVSIAFMKMLSWAFDLTYITRILELVNKYKIDCNMGLFQGKPKAPTHSTSIIVIPEPPKTAKYIIPSIASRISPANLIVLKNSQNTRNTKTVQFLVCDTISPSLRYTSLLLYART